MKNSAPGLGKYLLGHIMSVVLTVLICCLLSVGTVNAQQSSNEPLNNSAVIKLVKAGFKEKTIISIIHNRPNTFKLDTEQLIQLKRNGVSENIILAMLSQDYGLSGEDFGDDSFFRDSKRSAGNTPNGTDNGVDIFGSRGGSRSQSEQRGGNGASQSEGEVTGSATVRILRPPTEAGGAPPKLEKTPTLNNDAVVRLVEAGFSEGTIIKRIEDSPADFDLSPQKVEELHKRRVTDAIISAMSAAMGDKDQTKPISPSESET